MANDATMEPHTTYTLQRVEGTTVEWNQPSKILPLDSIVREAILAIEEEFNRWLEYLESRVAHLPSRTRSLIWILCAVPILADAGEVVPKREEVFEQLLMRLPDMQNKNYEDLLVFAGLTEAVGCVA